MNRDRLAILPLQHVVAGLRSCLDEALPQLTRRVLPHGGRELLHGHSKQFVVTIAGQLGGSSIRGDVAAGVVGRYGGNVEVSEFFLQRLEQRRVRQAAQAASQTIDLGSMGSGHVGTAIDNGRPQRVTELIPAVKLIGA